MVACKIRCRRGHFYKKTRKIKNKKNKREQKISCSLFCINKYPKNENQPPQEALSDPVKVSLGTVADKNTIGQA